MMTVKHITLSGEEFVYATSHVNFVPATALQGANYASGSAAVPDTVWRYDADGVARPITGGTVFVMNEHGKTVSRYDIGASMVPLTGAGSPVGQQSAA